MYVTLDEGPHHKTKRIEVYRGGRLSYQRHSFRSEHWFVVLGQATVEIDGNIHDLGPGQAIDIPRGSAHRVSNQSPETLVFIEVQTGSYFGEDDIVRLSDDYGRADDDQA